MESLKNVKCVLEKSLNCLLERGYEPCVMDGKEHGLKIFEKQANVYKVLMLNRKKCTKNIMFSAP